MKGKEIVKVTVFDEGKREDPYYKAEAYSTEKEKGRLMIDYLKNFFGMGHWDERFGQRTESEARKRWLAWNERHKIKWTRDERGNIISPFAKAKSESSKIQEENQDKSSPI